jgi:hypothetical protein
MDQINSTGTADAMFLKVFGGEVLAQFYDSNVMGPLHRVRTIQNGKSAQFPVLGKSTASYHTQGAELTGQAIGHAERVITIDDMLIADIFVPELDELKNHYDVRSVYSQTIGEELADAWDKHVLQTIGLGARASATVTATGNGGTQFTDTTYDTSGTALASGIFDAAEQFDTDEVPANGRYVAMRPAQYYLMAQVTNVINRDWGGKGAYAEGTVLKVAGLHVIKSNNVPSTDLSADAGGAQYQGNFANTYWLAWQQEAAATVKLRDVSMVVAPDARRVGTLMYGKMALGSSYLRPECCVEGITA